jgi:hypothetical protein
MARKISEIYDALNSSKASMQELHDFVVDSENPGTIQDNAETLAIDVKSNSKVAQWRLWLWIMAVASWVVENIFDLFKADISNILSTKRPHTLKWYAEETKKFQYGYGLVWKDDTYVYEVDDPDSRIVKYAACVEKQGKIVLKVAKEVGGVKTPLSVAEKAALTEFWRKYKDAGVRIEIVSLPADLFKANLTIVRDRLVLDGSNRLLRDASVYPIKNAIDTYGANLEFDGKIVLSKLVDAIQAAEGVVDVQLNSASVKPSGGAWSLVNMNAEAVSGYFLMSYTDSVINYIDNFTAETIE